MLEKALANEFIDFFQGYLSFYKDFFQLESEKFEDISMNRLNKLDECVNREEAFMLKSRGLEAERDRLVAKAGNPKATFKELIPLFEPPQREQIQQIYDELYQVLRSFKEINLRCNYLTELRLRRVQADIKKLEKRPDLQKIYNARAKENNIHTSFISKKV
ncbi:MAG: flagellar protein FlgN [Ruminococcaceae bacterium]|nr:flagellar protein FlgN [Oscillospiraceae bacterium]HHV31914.1 flagellar protein FlgN [Clostridiales bacterium]